MSEVNPKYLRELEVAEVSLVDKAANKRKFLIYKAEEKTMPKADELVLEGLGESMLSVLKAAAEDGEKELEEQIDALEISEKAKAAIRAAARALSSARKELPENVMEQLSKVAGFKIATERKEEGVEEEKEDVLKSVVMKADGTPDFDTVPDAVRPMVEMLWKSQKESAEKAERLEAILKAETDRRVVAECIRKCETDYNGLAVKPTDFAVVLKEMQEKLSDASFKEVDRVLKASAAAAKSLLKEVGSDGSEAETTAIGKLEAIAKQYMQEGKAPTFEVAFVKAMDDNPELAAAERAERAS